MSPQSPIPQPRLAGPVTEVGFPRATVDQVEVARDGNEVSCTVRITAASGVVSGTATEPDTPSGAVRAAARAALIAIEGLRPDCRLGLGGVRTIDLFGDPGLVLLVDARAGRHHARLPGSALVERSVEEAATRAVLHAMCGWNP